MRTILAILVFAAMTAAQAHDGHGAAGGAHVHATDLFGLLALALGAAWWINRRRDR